MENYLELGATGADGHDRAREIRAHHFRGSVRVGTTCKSSESVALDHQWQHRISRREAHKRSSRSAGFIEE